MSKKRKKGAPIEEVLTDEVETVDEAPTLTSSKDVKLDDVKYKATFLMDQLFQGQHYKKGETKEVPAHIENAYKQRSNLIKFEQL